MAVLLDGDCAARCFPGNSGQQQKERQTGKCVTFLRCKFETVSWISRIRVIKTQSLYYISISLFKFTWTPDLTNILEWFWRQNFRTEILKSAHSDSSLIFLPAPLEFGWWQQRRDAKLSQRFKRQCNEAVAALLRALKFKAFFPKWYM